MKILKKSYIFVILFISFCLNIKGVKALDWTCMYMDFSTEKSDTNYNLMYTVVIKDNWVDSITINPSKKGLRKNSVHKNSRVNFANSLFVTADGEATCPAKLYYGYGYETNHIGKVVKYVALLGTEPMKYTTVKDVLKDEISGHYTDVQGGSFELTYIKSNLGKLPNTDTGITGNGENLDTIAKPPAFEEPIEGGCGFIGENTLEIIEWIIKIIRIGIPILVIFLGITDFASAMFSGEEKDFKSCGTRFLKRLAAAIILIFLPYLIAFLINLSGIAGDYNISPDNMFCSLF